MNNTEKFGATFEQVGSLGIIRFWNVFANLLHFELLEMIGEAVSKAAASDVRALLIEGVGNDFCAGVDLNDFNGRTAREMRSQFTRGFPLVIQGIENLQMPVVFAVQGLCVAAGLELILCGDIVFAGRSAKFQQIEAKIGTSTLLGGAQRLAERCGSARAKEICFTTKRYDAETFERWNIINYVVDDGAVHDEARKFAEQMSCGPTKAHWVTKQLVRAQQDTGVRSADNLCLDIAPLLFETHDMPHGVKTVLTLGAKNVDKNTKFLGK
ncbi:enoyl-CoA hydratase/isomerase family protein [Bradyrhizobium sp.]|jgi:enoyl-CoA hydratase/carnithine racemase|uniref:enoyl-CoA hydratase/isomerase family protein n=1 Tax=Bradyrhizobium sp. TaxID=376 RepID=UPI002DDD7586|nr:enoyl-CoA hydratase/isomerase family protein [Bradyrhizobium sp.]HEV2160572.1 enoyl-CoA hydratase/isomerase family protein [Bradyrhizobium sp.]